MRKQVEQGTESFLQRHLSQLKIVARLLEHEVNATKQGASMTIDRDLVENLLDTVEIFIDDVGEAAGPRREREIKSTATDAKPAVTRLN